MQIEQTHSVQWLPSWNSRASPRTLREYGTALDYPGSPLPLLTCWPLPLTCVSSFLLPCLVRRHLSERRHTPDHCGVPAPQKQEATWSESLSVCRTKPNQTPMCLVRCFASNAVPAKFFIWKSIKISKVNTNWKDHLVILMTSWIGWATTGIGISLVKADVNPSGNTWKYMMEICWNILQ